jgi:hypothetical protein
MKNFYSIVAAFLMTASVFAQAPQKMSYQAVIRNSSDALVTSSVVGMQISILQGTATGTPVYVETQTQTTNTNGLVSLQIGSGTVVSGNFSTIDWANGPYFIQTETDPAGATNYSITGTSQMLSVPYALHAKTAETFIGGVNETDPTFTSSQAFNIDAADIINLSNLSGTNTGDQDLSDLATKTALGDSTSQLRSEIPDVSVFLTSETDPLFTNSQASNIDASDITNLSNLSGVNTGDQDLSDLATKTALGDSTSQLRSEIPDVSVFLTSETDPLFTNSQASNIDATDIINLSNLSGVNTGDQDLSNLATKTALGDSTSQLRSEIPDVSVFLTSETDPLFTNSQASNIDATDIINLSNLSGVNTGDQDLSNLATKTALGDSTSQLRSEIPDVSVFLTSETDPLFSTWDKNYNDLTNAPTIPVNVSELNNDAGYLTTEIDGSVTNEIQNLSQVLTEGNDANNNNIVNVAKIGVGTSNPSNSAALEISSTTGAILLSRMTTAQRDLLTAQEGMLIFNTDNNKYQGYAITGGGSSILHNDDAAISSSTSVGTDGGGTPNYVGQSFIPASDGVLQNIRVNVNRTSSDVVTLSVYSGSGYGGALLGESNTILNSAGAFTIDLSSLSINLQTGQTYSFRLYSSAGFTTCPIIFHMVNDGMGTDNATYSDGTYLDYLGNPVANSDLWFEIVIGASSSWFNLH